MKVGKAEAESDATPVDQDEWMVSMEREGGGVLSSRVKQTKRR